MKGILHKIFLDWWMWHPPLGDYKFRYDQTRRSYSDLLEVLKTKEDGFTQNFMQDIFFNFSGNKKGEGDLVEYYDAHICALYEQLINKAYYFYIGRQGESNPYHPEKPNAQELREDITNTRMEITRAVSTEITRRREVNNDRLKYIITTCIAVAALLTAIGSLLKG